MSRIGEPPIKQPPWRPDLTGDNQMTKKATSKPSESLNDFSVYIHHGDTPVVVRTDLRGRHRDYCLCYSCDKFFPEDREKNCKIANTLYAFNVLTNLVTPVWECPDFEIAGLMDNLSRLFNNEVWANQIVEE